MRRFRSMLGIASVALGSFLSVPSPDVLAAVIPVDIAITITSPSTLTAAGSFDLDTGTSMYSNLNVILNGTFGPLTFTNTACDGCPLGGSSVGLIDNTLVSAFFLQDFQMDFAGGAFGGGLTFIFRGNSFAVEDPNGRLDGTYGFETVSAVPEPATLVLLGIGLAGLGSSRRKQTTGQAPTRAPLRRGLHLHRQAGEGKLHLRLESDPRAAGRSLRVLHARAWHRRRPATSGALAVSRRSLVMMRRAPRLF